MSCVREPRFSGPVFRRKPGGLLGAPPPSQQEMFPDSTPTVPQYAPHTAIAALCSTRTFHTLPRHGRTCSTYASRSMQSQSDSTPHSLRHEPRIEHSFDASSRTPERCTERTVPDAHSVCIREVATGGPLRGIEQAFEKSKTPTHDRLRNRHEEQHDIVTHSEHQKRTWNARDGKHEMVQPGRHHHGGKGLTTQREKQEER